MFVKKVKKYHFFKKDISFNKIDWYRKMKEINISFNGWDLVVEYK